MNLSIEQITISLAILSMIGSGVAFLVNRPNQRASALKTMSETIDHLSCRVAELEIDRERDHNRIMILEAEGQQLERLLTLCVIGLQTLTAQLITAEIKPAWTPPEEIKQWGKAE